MNDWTGGLIERPDVPISFYRLPVLRHVCEDDQDDEPVVTTRGRGRPESPITAAIRALKVGGSFLLTNEQAWHVARKEQCRERGKYSISAQGVNCWRVWRLA